METALEPRKHLRIFRSVAPTATFKELQPWHLEKGFLLPLLNTIPSPENLASRKRSLHRVEEISAPRDASSSLSINDALSPFHALPSSV